MEIKLGWLGFVNGKEARIKKQKWGGRREQDRTCLSARLFESKFLVVRTC